jgi:hypothetical protein
MTVDSMATLLGYVEWSPVTNCTTMLPVEFGT